MSLILIADDDTELCALLSDYLLRQGLQSRALHSAEAAIAFLQSSTADALVLDVMLPGMDGLSALRQIRNFADLPVIMLSGRGEPVDRILGLELGADDYLAKPCVPRELLARIQAVLRRASANQTASSEIVVGKLRLWPQQRRAEVGSAPLLLTGAEFSVLRELARQAGIVIGRDQLTRSALNRGLDRYDRAIDVHISRLRQKLAALSAGVRIDAIRGAGYQLIVESPGVSA